MGVDMLHNLDLTGGQLRYRLLSDLHDMNMQALKDLLDLGLRLELRISWHNYFNELTKLSNVV